MEYLVHTSGRISNFQDKAYVVKASSEQEAKKIAKENFEREFDCIEINAEAKSYKRTKRAIMACVLMLVAVVISLFTFKSQERILFFFSKSVEFSIAPRMDSCVFAVIFYAVYAIRFKGIERTVGTHIDIVLTVITILLLSSVFQLILSTDNLKLFWFIDCPKPGVVLAITIIASLFGIKLMSACCMAFIAITAVSNLSNASNAMGIWGIIYVMCAFIGFLIYLSIEPSILEAFSEIKNSFSNQFKVAKNDFYVAKTETNAIVNKVIKK